MTEQELKIVILKSKLFELQIQQTKIREEMRTLINQLNEEEKNATK